MNELEFRLDIACGKAKKAGFTGVDIWEGADIVCDLEKFPWPFEDESVDEVFCSHYIEHTPDLISFANELYRIMKVGAKAEIIAPYYSSIRAWQDPTHLRAISENTFLYFNQEWRLLNRLDHYPIRADFDFEYCLNLHPDWVDRDKDELMFAVKHYINVVSDICVNLTKRSYEEACLPDFTRLWGNGDHDEAVKVGDQLIAQGCEDCEVLIIMAEHALASGDFCAAIERFRLVLGRGEGSLQAHCGFIRSLKMAKLDEDARLHLSGIRKKDPELADLIEEVISAEDD